VKQRSRTYNILHTVRGLRIDGVVMVILRTLSHAKSDGFRHHLCSMLPDDTLADTFRARGIEPHFAGHRGGLSAPVSIARLVKLIRELQIDLVHANRTMDLGIAGAAAKICGIPVVSSLHWLGRNQDHPEDEAGGWASMSKRIATVSMNRALADRVVAVSGAVRNSFGAWPGFPTSRTVVVYPGLDMDLPVPDAETHDRLRRELNLGSAHPVLLNVGRLVPVKGQKHLVPMMLRVRERLPRTRLLIAGEGHLRAVLEQQIQEQGLVGAVELLGSRSDVDDLLAVSDLLVMSSESEAAPLPPMEAMRAGKPVVATNVGGIPEIVADGVSGYVVPRADPRAMAAAVLKVFEHPDKAEQMGEAGRRVARERFDIEKSVGDLEALYLSLLRPDGTGAGRSLAQPSRVGSRRDEE
jgi:glycosyltransferase involved in cell wall biosynthesis